MRMRKKKNLLPRMERCAALQIKDPIAHRGHWRELMPEARELRVELGCGKGRFTVGTAAAEPDVLFVAVEMVPDAMVVAMERCAAEGLRNVRFIDANANILPEFFAPGEVDRIYINFCDPWPTKRHAKRRLSDAAARYGTAISSSSTARYSRTAGRPISRRTTPRFSPGRWRRSRSSALRSPRSQTICTRTAPSA